MDNLNHLPTYEQDFYAWALENANLLRQKKFDEIDIEHIAEEIESMGRGEKNQFISHLAVLIAHLLKWQYQPDRRGSSWEKTINYQRYRIPKLLKESPSLKYNIDETLDDAYLRGVSIASAEMIKAEIEFPEVCPFSLEQCLDAAFLPD